MIISQGDSPFPNLSTVPCQISMPEACGSTAVLVSVTDDLVQVLFQADFQADYQANFPTDFQVDFQEDFQANFQADFQSDFQAVFVRIFDVENASTSKNVHRGCHNDLGGQGILKVQNSYKSLYKNCVKPLSKIRRIFRYLYLLLADCLCPHILSEEMN